MTWISSQFAWPNSADSIFSQTESALSDSVTQCDEHSQLLTSLDSLSVVNSGTVDSASFADALYQQFTGLIAGKGLIAVAHPWQHTTGQGEGHQRALSVPNAILSLSQKIKTLKPPVEESLEAVAVLLTANNIQSLCETLEAFNSVFSIPEIEFVKRKANQVLDIENSKIISTNSKPVTNISPRSVNQFHQVGEVEQSIENIFGNLNAMNLESTHPTNELEQVIQRKKAMLEKRDTDYQALKSSMTGASFFAHTTSGQDLFDIGNAIEQSSYPGHEWSHSVAVIFIGNQGEVTLIKEAFGL